MMRILFFLCSYIIFPCFLYATSDDVVLLEACTIEDLQSHLSQAQASSVCAWDCDNTFVVDKCRGVFDFELCREHQRYWVEAGHYAREMGYYAQDPVTFPQACADLVRMSEKEYFLVDEGLPALDADLWERGTETFICTGLSPCESKRDYMRSQRLDWGARYESSSHVMPLFFEEANGWLYATGNKAQKLMEFVLERNKDRASRCLGPITDLYFVDNHQKTLRDVGCLFNLGGVTLHLIHWRKHALTLEHEHQQGLLIQRIAEGYNEINSAPKRRFLLDDGYESPADDYDDISSLDCVSQTMPSVTLSGLSASPTKQTSSKEG